jgi:hypothetical protein
MMSGGEVTRELSDDEIKELAAKCSRWTKPLDASGDILRLHPHKHMLQLFRFFNGLPGKTVSQAIDVVLVPTDTMKCRVLAYMDACPARFSSPLPVVRVFGEAALTL